jgi:hypothetical protein
MSPSTNRSAKTSKTSKATKTTASSTKAKTTKSKAKKQDEELALEQDLEILPEVAESVSPSDEISHVTESGQVAEVATDSIIKSETATKAKTTKTNKTTKTTKTSENIETAENIVANQVTETVNELPANSVEPVATAEIVDENENPASVGGRPKTTPISPPGEDKQYRAIGLVLGRYIPSEEQFTKGILVTRDGTEIDAVLLGRVLTLLKNHLDLSKEHLWVVYPRSRQLENDLHLQIMGVWEPETLKKTMVSNLAEPQLFAPFVDLNSNYFSVRGEVIFQSVEEEYVVVKIKQAPKKPTEQPKFFKLKISGNLGDRPVNHFWDLHLLLQGKCLCIQQANDIGVLFVKPKPGGFKGKGKGKGGNFKPRYDGDKPRKFSGDGEQSDKNLKPVKEKPTKSTES